MIFREIEYPSDERSQAASELLSLELYEGGISPETVMRMMVANNGDHYCLESSSDLLAVGTLNRRFSAYQVAVIANIAVASYARDQGVGTGLIDRLEDEARQQGNRIVTVDALKSAVGFYQKLGYETTDSADRLVGMAKLL